MYAAYLPDVSRFGQSGSPQTTFSIWFGCGVSAGLPPEIIARWDAEIAAALADPGMIERLPAMGVRPGAEAPVDDIALIAA